MTIYKVIRAWQDDPDNGPHLTYGIRAAEPERSVDIGDISSCEREMIELANRMNVLGLDIDHFQDVVEDYLESKQE